jgi:phosphoribosylformylglycinamidine synthase
MAGQIDDITRRCAPGFVAAGDEIFLLGGDTVSLGGSLYGWMRGGALCGAPAPLDLDLERRVQACLRAAIARGLLRSAHDCSDGGLAVAVAECVLAGNIGAAIEPPRAMGAAGGVADYLFGEGPARVVVSLAASAATELRAMARQEGVPVQRLGTVGGAALTWGDLFVLEVVELRAAWAGALDGLTRS